jgi:hypothetical protein
MRKYKLIFHKTKAINFDFHPKSFLEPKNFVTIDKFDLFFLTFEYFIQ